jgi:hypothetical protein
MGTASEHHGKAMQSRLQHSNVTALLLLYMLIHCYTFQIMERIRLLGLRACFSQMPADLILVIHRLGYTMYGMAVTSCAASGTRLVTGR